MAAAFAVPEGRRHRIEGRNVLLIDDVITTGATINACARALKSAGAKRVDVLALAIALDEPDASDLAAARNS
jgi:predicted amidophosphoribosyltransferase